MARYLLPDGPPSAQSSFARQERYLRRGDVLHRLKRHYPFFIAHTSSRASPTLFHLLRPRPRWADLCRLLPVLAESGAFPTLSLRALAWMSGPLPRWDTECSCSLLPPYRRPSPTGNGSASHKVPPDDFSVGVVFEAAAIPLRSDLQACLPSRSSLPQRYSRWAAMAFTSGQNMCRYLHMHRICYPSETSN